jgi:hypothetical protein
MLAMVAPSHDVVRGVLTLLMGASFTGAVRALIVITHSRPDKRSLGRRSAAVNGRHRVNGGSP